MPTLAQPKTGSMPNSERSALTSTSAYLSPAGSGLYHHNHCAHEGRQRPRFPKLHVRQQLAGIDGAASKPRLKDGSKSRRGMALAGALQLLYSGGVSLQGDGLPPLAASALRSVGLRLHRRRADERTYLGTGPMCNSVAGSRRSPALQALRFVRAQSECLAAPLVSALPQQEPRRAPTDSSDSATTPELRAARSRQRSGPGYREPHQPQMGEQSELGRGSCIPW